MNKRQSINQESPEISWFHVVLSILFALTLFLPGEQVERSGLFHLPCLLWMLTAAVWLGLPLLKIGNLPGLRFSSIDVFVYVFFAAVCLSIGWNLLPGCGGAPRPCLNTLSAWLGLAAAWFLFRQLLRNEKSVTIMFGIVVAVMLTQAVLGLEQYFVEIPDTLRQFEINPERTIAQIDASIKPNTPDWDRLVSRLKTIGPMGTYPMTNSLGGLLGCWFIFLLGYFVVQKQQPEASAPGSSRQRAIPSLLFGAVVLVILACFILTKCRSGIVAVGVGIVLLAIFQFRHRLDKRLIFIGGMIVALIVAGALATSGKSLVSGAKRSLGFRLEYWQASLGMIRDYPIFGCGSGNFKQSYTKYKLPQASEEVSDPHHFAVEIAAASGIPALCLFGLIIFTVLKSRKCRRYPVETSGFPADKISDARIFFGGFFGCLLAFCFSFNGEAAMDVGVLVCAAAAFPCVYWLFKYFESEIPSPLIWITLIVLLVHLSAAGGISVTSTAICLWFLLAVLANRCESAVIEQRFVRIGLAVLLAAGIVFVQQTGLKPVLRSHSLTLQADESRDGFLRLALLRQAVEADSWSSAAQERLVTELFQFWLQNPSDPARKAEVIETQRQAVRLMPRSAVLRFVCAERLNLMFEQTGDSKLAESALEYYRDAVTLYPNLAKFRAPYSLLLWKTAGDSQEKRQDALRQRDLAVKLDDTMPHADQKLTPEQRQALEFR